MLRAILFAAALLILTSSAHPQESNGPWAPPERVCTSMEKAGPVAATFSMINTPAGALKGESESGRVAIALPGCIRWDYEQPKSFLVCNGMEYYWNREDAAGKRSRVDYNQEPALAFLLVDIDLLKRNYSASDRSVGGRSEISLTPKKALGFIRDAVLTVDPESERVREFSYHDMMGNFTRFVIDKYESLRDSSLFSPPEGVTWTGPDI